MYMYSDVRAKGDWSDELRYWKSRQGAPENDLGTSWCSFSERNGALRTRARLGRFFKLSIAHKSVPFYWTVAPQHSNLKRKNTNLYSGRKNEKPPLMFWPVSAQVWTYYYLQDLSFAVARNRAGQNVFIDRVYSFLCVTLF